MKRSFLLLTGTLIICYIPTAALDVFQTENTKVCRGDTFYKAREIGMLIRFDQFPNASETTPNYVSIDMEPISGTTLAETLVDVGGEPIYLGLYLKYTEDPEVRMAAPPTTMSIVRWRRGERWIWLRVEQSSRNWLEKNGMPISLEDGRFEVAWSIGIDAETARKKLEPLYQNGLANRPNHAGTDQSPANTDIVLDLSNHIYGQDVNSVTVEFYPRGSDVTGVETAENEEDIDRGSSARPDVPSFGPNLPLLRFSDCTEHQYPWVSYNDQFTSTIVANNPSAEPATVNFIATRNDGSDYYATRELPPHGFLAENPAALFPEMPKGAGFSLLMRAEPDAAGRWVTYNTSTASNRSPSQGTATRLDDPNGVADTLLFGYLPLGEGFNSAPVIVNAGPLPVDVTLYFYNQAGNLILQDSELIKGLGGYRPFAVPTAELLPGHSGDMQMIAHSTEGKITGAVFTFNGNLEPAIGNAQAIPFEPGKLRVKSFK